MNGQRIQDFSMGKYGKAEKIRWQTK